jgi:hypothetical protein
VANGGGDSRPGRLRHQHWVSQHGQLDFRAARH